MLVGAFFFQRADVTVRAPTRMPDPGDRAKTAVKNEKDVWYKAVVGVLLLCAIIAVTRLDAGWGEFFSHPAQHDDYKLLSFSLADKSFPYTRPVSTVIKRVLSALGYDGFTTVLHLLVAVYAFLVLAFVFKLFDVRLTVVSIGLSGAMIALSPVLVRYYTYLGLNTNLTSGVFGAAALLCFLTALRSQAKRWWAAALVLVALSAFAKEDFVLPSVALLIASLVFGESLVGGRMKRSSAALGLAGIGAVVLAVVLYSLWSGNPSTAGGDGAYALSLAPASVLQVLASYLFEPKFTLPVMIVAAAASLVALMAARDRKTLSLRLLVVWGIPVTLVLPYSVLAGHVHPYYGFMWQVWICAIAVGGLAVGLERVKSHALKAGAYIALVAAIGAVAFHSAKQRGSVKTWVRHHAEVNRNVMDSLNEMRPALAGESRVGILTPPRLSPWTKHDGGYLKKVAGFDLEWIVFVEDKRVKRFLPRGQRKWGTVEVRSAASVCAEPDLKVIRFDESGRGKLAAACPRALTE